MVQSLINDQAFIRGLHNGTKEAWIGLNWTDGNWTWVDGTPLTIE